MACQAQQSPTPSDAKISDLTNILAPLLTPSEAQSATQRGSTLGSIDPQSPLSPLSSTTSQSEPNLLAKSAEESYQLPERVLHHNQPLISELPDLGYDVWGVHPTDHDWRSPTGDLSASSSDINSPHSSSLQNVMSPGPSPAPPPHMPPPPAAPMLPHLPPPYEATCNVEHTRSSSLPADMYFADFDETFDSSPHM